MKKYLCLLLALTMVFCAFATVSPFASANSTPEVVLRYITTSDIHNTYDNVGAMLQTAYNYSQTQDYKGIDAVVVAGDTVSTPTEAAYQEIKSTFDTELGKLSEVGCNPQLIIAMGNHDHKAVEGRTKTCREVFEEQLGMEPDHDYTVKGYHFITLSATEWEGHYTMDQFNWLDGRLAAAEQEDADKPIMFIIHEPMKGTVYGTEEGCTHCQTYSQDKIDILNKYSQLIIWSGHTHSFTNHQRGIWQSDAGWVQLCTGTLSNYGRSWDPVSIEGDGDGLGDGVKMTPIFSIVEVLSDNSTVVKHSTIDGHMFADQWHIGENYDNTTAGRTAASTAPQFADGAQLGIVTGSESISVTVPQSADIENTEYYQIDAVPDEGETVTLRISSKYWMATPPETLSATVAGLEQNTDYTINVYPVGFYGKQGAPLTQSLTTSYVLADSLDTVMSGVIKATNQNGKDIWSGNVSNISDAGFINVSSSSAYTITSVSDFNLGDQFEISVNYTRPDYNYYDKNFSYIQVGDIGLAMRRSDITHSSVDYTDDTLAICYGYNVNSKDNPFDAKYVIKQVDIPHIVSTAEYRLTYDKGRIFASRNGVNYVDISSEELAEVAGTVDFSSAKISLKIHEQWSKDAGFKTFNLYADTSNMDTVTYKSTVYTLSQVNDIIDGLVVNGKVVADQATIDLAYGLYDALASYQLEKVNADKLVFTKAVTAGVPADVNSDGVVDSTDYLNVTMLVLDMVQLDDVTLARCDVNRSGKVDSADALAVRFALLGIVA